MDTTQRVALAERLARAEAELRAAQAGMDGSPTSRTRLAQARAEHRAAEAGALMLLAADNERNLPCRSASDSEIQTLSIQLGS